MGIDTYPVLGRVKREYRLEHNSHDSNPVMAFASLAPDMLEFIYPDAGGPDRHGNVVIGLDRSPALFAWLCNVSGIIKPLTGYEERLAATAQCIAQLREGNPTYLDDSWYAPLWCPDIELRYFDGYHSQILYPIEFLLNYNYDQVAYRWDRDIPVIETEPEGEWRKLYLPHPDGKTLRELFGTNYFEYIHAVKAKDWDFIIFQFD